MKTRLFVVIGSVAIIILGVIYVFQTRIASAPTDEVTATDTLAQPTRPPYPNCSWERLTGMSFTLWGQNCGEVAVHISETLPGVFLERQTPTGPIAEMLLVQVFDLPTGEIADVLPTLAQHSLWDKNEACAFAIDTLQPVSGVTRYNLRPTGGALTAYEKSAAKQPILSTCAGYGLGNSGVRYFEVHDSHPNKAIFINASQEEPLFDLTSIELI